jgi:GTP-binding protein
LLRRGNAEVVIADIPGLIEGASEGAGLGHRFLRHVGRTTALVYMVDLGEDYPERSVALLERELSAYDPDLAEKSRLVVGSKKDRDGAAGRYIGLCKAYPDETILGVSVFSREGLDILTEALFSLKGAPEGTTR